ncbi:MFS transporter, CP family, cyanate transporter [Rathayibacter oskolensis]|uniref:MFS transporter, CP family, cyanate transporter n=1 Tax=Rathayibacter oskolensis TaxID=1891671 RepID=A0A1X7MTD3_9MICO|nr:MFS transporter [Rathayibacter oskolensis]SMH27975.1 MFS transporter, CP family, cyanate transporter [Rathayibacter oskolensis]
MSSPVITSTRGATASLALAAVVMTALNLRTAVTGFSPLLETIGADLGFGPALYGAFGTIVTASFAVFGFVASAAARRLGLERTLAAATLVTTAGLILRALSPAPLALVLSSVVALAGVGMSNVLIIPIVKRYFADRLRAVSSLYLALLQVGQFVAPLVAVPLAQSLGWRSAVGGWALLTATACLLWLALATRETATTAPAAHAERLTGAWRTPLLWAMVLLLGMTALNTYAVITWLPTILVDAGADPALGGALLALFSIFGLGAAFVVPPLTLGMRNPVVIVVVCVALLAVGYLGLLVAPLEGAVAWVVCLGLGVSTFPLTLTLVNARTRTTAGSSVLSGATQGLGYALACAGPLVIGLLYEAQGGWGGASVFLLASLVVLLVSGIVACRPRFLEDEASRRG